MLTIIIMQLKHPTVEPKFESSEPRWAPSCLVRIDISKTASRERVRDVGDAVYNAMIAVANVPNYDKFQVVTRHEPDEITYPEEGYLGIDYTPDLIIIQVTWVGGRSTDLRLEVGRRIVDICAEVLGVPKRTVLVEFTVHSGDEILRDCERAGEWTAAEASTLPSPTDARS
jgi:4-oxalocrotonate tautomerase